ncbi:MAG: hypothetical protein LCH52_06740 [Bacteroidetes bacterium]|nr:hypothetical protein [Bacteroidota bacterium]
MEKKKRIFEYLDNKPGKAGTSNFEADIKEDDELYSEYVKVKDSLLKLDNLAQVESDTLYFENVLPRFRENLELKRQKRFSPVFAKLAAGLAIPVLATVLFIARPWDTQIQVPATVEKENTVATSPGIKTETPVEEEQKESVAVKPQYRYTASQSNNSPVLEKSDKNEILLGSTTLVDDATLAAHAKFHEAYNSLLEMNTTSLLEIADKYGISLDEVVQNLSDEEIEKLSGQIDPIVN